MNSSKLADYLLGQDFAEIAQQKKKEALQARLNAQEAETKRLAEEKKAQEAAQQAVVITESDVKQAADEAYEKGIQVGRQEGRSQEQALSKKHLLDLISQLSSLEKLGQDYLDTLGSEMLSKATSLFKETFREKFNSDDLSPIKEALSELSQHLPTTRALSLEMHPSTHIYLTEIAENLMPKHDIHTHENPTLSQGQMIISWQTGGIDINPAHLEKSLEKAAAASLEEIPIPNIDAAFLDTHNEETAIPKDDADNATQNTQTDTETPQ